MALILPSNYHKIRDVEKNHISWIEPELAERQDIRPLKNWHPKYYASWQAI